MDAIITQNESQEKVRENKFKRSSKVIKATFILGIIEIVWIGILTPTIDSVVYYFLFGNSKIPLYLNFSLFLGAALVCLILGGISFRKGINVYGIIGFILNFITFAFMIGAIFMTTQIP
ncbi:MAG: hypothetical protein JXA54_07735 [Candidatus Heimdallarchaeota archaeon]|nr:hypothetical protein [Candidatus Heimdallarchaeota archaeon]